MVERVKITPSQILLKDAEGNIKFNTDYAYIKTGGGTLYAGGYQRAPAIYGQNSVTDHPSEGLYTVGFFEGSFNPAINKRYYWNAPKANLVQFRTVPDGSGDTGTGTFLSTNVRTLQYFNYDTRVLSNTSITYRWAMTRRGYNPDSYGNYAYLQWQAFPVFSSSVFPEASNPSGGSYEITYQANEHNNWQRTVTTTDEYGNSYTSTQIGVNYYGQRTGSNEYGTYTIPAEPIYWVRNALFTKREPVALSLAVTP